MENKDIIKKERVVFLDLWRGVAIIFMVIFHLVYDLNYFNILKINFSKGTFWYYFPRLIVFMFLLGVGAGQNIVHRKNIQYQKVIKRFILLLICSLGISLSTYYLFPNNWIYFGIIHNIMISSLLILFFINRPKISLILFFIILVLYFLGGAGEFPAPKIFNYNRAMDHIPLFPWFAVVLLGSCIEKAKFFHFCKNINKGFQWIIFLGQHSLVIYLIHQPILYGIIKLYLVSFLNK